MEIVKAGDPSHVWPREYEVNCCASILRILPEDIKVDRDYTGDLNGYYLDCPVCGAQPEVPRSMKYKGDRWQSQQQQAAATPGGRPEWATSEVEKASRKGSP